VKPFSSNGAFVAASFVFPCIISSLSHTSSIGFFSGTSSVLTSHSSLLPAGHTLATGGDVTSTTPVTTKGNCSDGCFRDITEEPL
jgi:hypothetical protein